MLSACMLVDRERLGAGLRRARSEAERAAAEAAVARSAARRAERLSRLPRPTFPPELPVCERREEIRQAIEKHQVVVVCGETGSGKTTQLPKICLELGRGVGGLIGHTQPRRIAARAVATRVGEELGSRSHVGCKVRFNDETHADNFIKVMTDGILLAETQGDRDLWAYDTIIIDEAHERSLNIDFLLGYLRQLLPRRADLKVVITSATIDPERFAEHFAGANGAAAPIIEVSGRVYPVEVRYRAVEADTEEIDEDEPDEQEAILRAVDEVSAPGMPGGDILVFLSGEREIRETAESLRKHHPPSTQVLPLYARLSADEQQRVFRTTPGVRRIVLATNVAETSLTVPGIRYVIDPGVARISRYSPRTKVQRLPIEKVSRASADQRKGRCGRLSDGVCIRLYSEKDYEERARFTEPEILRTNLAAVILQMAALRLGRVDRFPFLEPPDARMIRDGYETLVELGAIKEDPGEGEPRLTEIGRRLSRLPVDPRIGRIILAGEKEGCLGEALIVAAALSVQDPRERPMELADKADQAHAQFADPESDFAGYLKLWDAYHEKKKHASGAQLRKWCKEHFISFMRMREWHDVHSQLKELAGEMGMRASAAASSVAGRSDGHAGSPGLAAKPARPGQPGPGLASKPARPGQPVRARDALHRALLTGLLSSVGRLPEPGKQAGSRFEYHGPRGMRFSIFPGSGLFKKSPKWVVAAEIVKTTKSYARTVAAVKPEWIESAGAHLLKRSYLDPHWDEQRAQVRAKERVSLLGLELVSGRGVHYGPIEPRVSREIFIHHALVEGEYWSNQAWAKHNRVLMREVEALQHKLRTRDFALDERARFEFFDKRLPAEAYSGQAFEAWLRGNQRSNPRVLFMSMGDLLQPGFGIDAESLAREYPDSLELRGMGPSAESCMLPLAYLYQPGHCSDGVTLTVPLPMLASIDAKRLEWLVPGMIEEKVVALMRTLPKDARRSMVPIPEFAEKALSQLEFGEGDLVETLARALGRLTGTVVEARDFDPGAVPAELRMNLRVVEEGAPVSPSGPGPDDRATSPGPAAPGPGQPGGKILAEGRNLGAIQSQLRGLVQATLASAERSPWNRDGISDWDFGDLPECVIVERGGIRFPAYPAVVDPRDRRRPGKAPRTVSLRLCDSAARAGALTRRGLRRLFSIRARDELRYHVDHGTDVEELLVDYGPIGSPADLKEDLSDAAAHQAFLENAPLVRTKEAFEARLEERWDRVPAAASDILRIVHAVLTARQSFALRFPEFVLAPSAAIGLAPALHPAVSDVRLQLAMLLGPGFVSATPTERLRHVPRYLQAIDRRLSRLAAGGAAAVERDRVLMDQVRPFWVAYLDRARVLAEESRDEPGVEEFRWLVEEFRVSLFAQELGTLEPVSAKRLERKWGEVSGGTRGGEPA